MIFKLENEHKQTEDKMLVHESNAAIYDLTQAGQLWYIYYSTFLEKQGFTEARNVPGSFRKRSEKNRILVNLLVASFSFK